MRFHRVRVRLRSALIALIAVAIARRVSAWSVAIASLEFFEQGARFYPDPYGFRYGRSPAGALGA